MTYFGEFQTLGSVPVSVLGAAHRELHAAAQLVAAVGNTYRQPRPDFSHQVLRWDARLGALVGLASEAAPFTRAALRPADFSLQLLDSRGEELACLELMGETPARALEWLAGKLAVRAMGQPPRLPGFQLPERAQGPYRVDLAASAELGRWYHDAGLLLERFASGQPHASAVRCWPHHFDIATLLTVEEHADPERVRTVGLGFTPADGVESEPYFYVSPWPYPAAPELPELEHGRWHTDGFFGAVLPASKITSLDDPGEQAERVWGFLERAVDASRELLA